MIFWHCCAFHALLMIAFWEADWDNLSVVCITHALGKIVRQLIDARIGHPPRWAGSVVPSFRQKGRSQSLTEHVSICLLYSLIPICYFTEKALRPGGVLSSRSDDLDTNSWGGSTRVYDVISVAYVATFAGSWLLHTKPGQRLRSLWRTKHMNHIGNETQLDVPFDTWLTYSVFWSVVLVFKLMFGWLLISPLATQVRGIINYEHFAYIGMEGSECKNHYSCLTFNSVMRAVMVALRCVVPFLVFQFDTSSSVVDTYICAIQPAQFSLTAALCSSLLALRRKLGVISQWKHLVAKLPECVHHFNVKLLGTHNGDAAAAAAAAAKSDTVDWSVEARSAEWQCFARAWNEMVLQLRFNDNEERDELLFPLLSGRDCEAFFDVPEYVIFPTMLTAPALAPSAWQHGKRAYASFERSLLQMRDLVVWLLVQLGIVTMDEKMHVLDILTKMARLQAMRLAASHI